MLRRLAVFGCLGTLLPILLVIAGLLLAGDVAARRYATGQLSDRISAAVPEASGVHARIHSFPFLGRLLFNEKVSEVGVHIDRLVAVRGIVFTSLDVDLRGVGLDRHAMFSDRQIQLDHINRGTVTVALTEQAVSAALGRPATIAHGVIDVSVLGGQTATATVAVSGHQLVIRVAPLPGVVVPLPNTGVLPCTPGATVGTGQVTFSCTFTRIPDAFVRLVRKAA